MIDESKLIGIKGDEEVDLEDMNNWYDGDDYCSENVGINFTGDNVEASNTENIPVQDIEI